MVQQLHEKELDSKKPQYYDYKGAIDKRNGRFYHIIVFVRDNDADFVNFINIVYLKKKKNIKIKLKN